MATRHTTSWNSLQALAAAIMAAAFGSGYAISTFDTAQPVQPAEFASPAPFEYFPGQYLNQAQAREEHIQAF